MWLERKRFPALELGPDEGIIAITTGVKAEDVGDQDKETVLYNRVFDESTLQYACKRWDSSRSPRSITTKRWWRLPQRSAGNSRSRVTNQSRAEAHSAQRLWVAIRTLEVYVGGSRRQMTKHEWSEPDCVNDEGMTKLV